MANREISVSFSNNRVNEIEMGERLEIKLKAPKEEGELTNLKVLFNREGENPSIMVEMKRKTKEEEDYYEYYADVTFNKLGNYFFFFSFFTPEGCWKAIKISRKTNKPFITTEESPYWRMLVVPKEFRVPEWAKSQVVYQLFVDRFNRGKGEIVKVNGRNYREWGEMPEYHRNKQGKFHNNDFFEGNIKGIIEKLDYLQKLSVGIVYLSPIAFSSLRYDRYAATDLMQIDPNAGTFEDLKAGHEAVRARGMHWILDISLNHCSSDNPIFIDAMSNPNSKYRDWFFINDDGTYQYWYGLFEDMPIFNQKSKGYREYICGEGGVIEKWSKYFDGFRLDVGTEQDKEFLAMVRRKANECGVHLLITEAWHEVPIYELGKCYDTMTNYPYAEAIYKWGLDKQIEFFKWQIQRILEIYPLETISTMLNSLDTHDMVRALTMLGGKWIRHGNERPWEIDKDPSPWHVVVNGVKQFLTDQFRKDEFENDRLSPKKYRKAKKLLKVLSVLQYFLPGNPCLYYGTEVGSHGYKDPFNRKCFPWERIDKDLLRHFIKLGKTFKNNRESLLDNNYNFVFGDEDVLWFERKDLVIIVNISEEKRNIKLPTGKILFAVDNKQRCTRDAILPLSGVVITR